MPHSQVIRAIHDDTFSRFLCPQTRFLKELRCLLQYLLLATPFCLVLFKHAFEYNLKHNFLLNNINYLIILNLIKRLHLILLIDAGF